MRTRKQYRDIQYVEVQINTHMLVGTLLCLTLNSELLSFHLPAHQRSCNVTLLLTVAFEILPGPKCRMCNVPRDQLVTRWASNAPSFQPSAKFVDVIEDEEQREAVRSAEVKTVAKNQVVYTSAICFLTTRCCLTALHYLLHYLIEFDWCL